ncbi:MAG TPA: FkbM family methyltransferase [Nitrososphaeraceae archaeon]|nr:FkbM family methyltransferase [Nitrososphaeraceae archaeon]
MLTAHIHALLKYRRVYLNYVTVLFHVLRNKYPIEAILKRGNYVLLHNHSEAILVTLMESFGFKTYQIINNKIRLDGIVSKADLRTNIEFYDGVENGDLVSVFLAEHYKFLPVEGNVVIDIGANIGDSCIYFALRGARQIIALEPFPKNFEIAQRNIEVNGFKDKIIMQLAGCAAKVGYIAVDPNYNSNGNSYLREFNEGTKVPLLTLSEILRKYNISSRDVVLKIDCEGCEYQTILSSEDCTLKFFSHILIEYHDGYKNLKEKLEKCDFIVTVTTPLLEQSATSLGKKMSFAGYLYATRKKI